MSDGEELLGKADALLSRYRTTAVPQEAPLPDFPVLTEVVEAIEGSAQPLQVAVALPLETQAEFSEQVLDQELKQLEEELLRRILISIEPYVSSFLGEPLEMRIKSHIGPALDRLSEQISTAAREETAELVRKAVAGAVEREITELRARIKS